MKRMFKYGLAILFPFLSVPVLFVLKGDKTIHRNIY